MSEVIGMKLTNGETLLGIIVQETEIQTVIKNPITIKYLWDEIPPTIYATPSCPLAFGETHISLVRHHIVGLFRPSETLLEYYTNSIQNILETDEDEVDLEDLEISDMMSANTEGTVH